MSAPPLSLPQGYEYFWYDEIDSTNQEALRRSKDGQKPNSWFCARQQSEGRGTKGNKWISQTGNLYASLFIGSNCPPDKLAQISVLAGLAAITAIEQVVGEEFSLDDLCLKWPNDLLLEGRKICGILVESRQAPQTGFYDIVIGSGVNICTNPELEGRYRAANLRDRGGSCSRQELFVALAQSTRDWLSIWRHGDGFETLRLAWLERSCHIGRKITLMVGDRLHEGRMTTMSSGGALVLEDHEGNENVFSSGSIIKIEGSFFR